MLLLASMFLTMRRARKFTNTLLFEVLVKYVYYTCYLLQIYCKNKIKSGNQEDSNVYISYSKQIYQEHILCSS